MTDYQNGSVTPTEDGKIEGAKIKVKSRALLWLENYFYHYKWHTVIALVLILAVVLCSVQMCAKTSYDTYIMYAGGTDIRMTAKDGDISDFQKLTSAFKQYSSDFDGDGEHNVSFLNLYMPSEDEIRDVEENTDSEVNLTLVSQNNETLWQHMYYGAYQICFLSEHLYTKWTEEVESTPLAEISPYLPEGSTLEVAKGGFGVYLASSPLYEKAGFNLLGSDTVICIRRMSLMSEAFGREDNLENFKRSEEVLRLMLSAK